MTKAKSGRQVYCVITDVMGNTVTTKTVTLRAAASITKQPVNASAYQNKTVKTSFTAYGSKLTYQWYLCNPGSTKFSKSSNTTSAYSCKMTDANNGRKVYCVVTDSYGNTAKTKTVTLTLKKGITITKEPADQQAMLGKKASTSVTASGSNLTYQWYLQDPGKTSYTKSSIKTATYSYVMTKAKSGRKVYCVITDDEGNSVKTRTATLSAAASITKQPTDAAALSGKTVKTSLTAYGTSLKYQWYICAPGKTTFEKSSNSGRTYSCKMNEKNNGRKVYCIITDGYGNTVKSDTVTLTLQ